MRLRSIVAVGLVLAPVSAFAAEATPASPPAPLPAAVAPAAPAPDGYRVLAITAGAVVGIAVVEFLSGGSITPVLVAGGPAMIEPVAAGAAPAAAAAGAVVEPVAAAPVASGYSLLEVVKVASGAFVGGQIGNMLYGK